MNMADELLCTAAERDADRLDETLFFDVFKPPAPKKPRRAAKAKR